VLSDTVAGITLAAAVIDTTLLARGERTTVTLYWHRAGVPSRFPVASWLRLDTPAPQGRFWSAGLSKLHRNLFREREGEIYRLEVARPLLDGLFGVEHWPPDGFVVDRVGVRMPEAAVPGDFVVGVKWMEATVLPNLPLRHFFADDDAYVGTPIGALEVY